MQLVFQSHFSTIVKTNDYKEILADSYYVSTKHEATGHIQANIDDFIIAKANWDVCRSHRVHEIGSADVNHLIGQEAYFNVGPALNEAFGSVGAFQKELIAECVRGIIQAETYLYNERGFESPESYDNAWKIMYLNSCRYYSHLDRVVNKWHEHVGKLDRLDYLFHRNKTCSIIDNNEKNLLVTGYFSDSFHQMGVMMGLTDGVIVNCTGNLLRAPDKVCFETGAYLTGLVGMNVNELNKKEASKTIGGSQGCSHLVDIVSEMVRSIQFCNQID